MNRLGVVGFALAALLMAGLGLGSLTADEKKDGGKDKPAEKKSGTVVGVVTAKAENWIEVKADGEEKGRRYFPHWRGGAPAAGGGPDKEMVKLFKETPIGSRVRLQWVFEERPRADKLEILKKASDKDKPTKDK